MIGAHRHRYERAHNWLANAVAVRRSTELSCSSARKRSIVAIMDGAQFIARRNNDKGENAGGGPLNPPIWDTKWGA